MKNAWHVVYSTPEHDKSEIVIWSDNKSEVKQILKKHLGNKKFTINRITERHVAEEDYPIPRFMRKEVRA